MLSRQLVGFCLAVAILIPSRYVRAEVIHGTVALHPTYVMGWPDPMVWHDGFYFETQTIVVYTTDASDLSWAEVTPDGEATFFPHSDGGIQLAGPAGSHLAELDTAPAIPANYFESRRLDPGSVYVMRTGAGHYVKFALHVPDEGADTTIEYYVQMDGSQSFGPALAVQPTTWGGVEALYR
jgi:hypothetical protein